MPLLTSRARRELEALPEPLQSHARALCARLDTEPALGKKLQGKLRGTRSARLGRSYRVLYPADASGITVLTIRPRRDAYG